jgi:phasin
MDEITAATPTSEAGPSGTLVTPEFQKTFASMAAEAPAAFRELAEKGLSRAKDSYEKMKSAAEEAGSLLEASSSCATKGATDYGLKLIETARTNTNATFDYVAGLMAAKSPSEVIELSTAHARRQFETVASQMHDLTGLAQKVMTETAEPLKGGFDRMVRKAS